MAILLRNSTNWHEAHPTRCRSSDYLETPVHTGHSESKSSTSFVRPIRSSVTTTSDHITPYPPYIVSPSSTAGAFGWAPAPTTHRPVDTGFISITDLSTSSVDVPLSSTVSRSSLFATLTVVSIPSVSPILTVPTRPSDIPSVRNPSTVLGAPTMEDGNKGATAGVKVGFIGGAILGAAAVAVCLVFISKWYQSRQTKYRTNYRTQEVSHFSD